MDDNLLQAIQQMKNGEEKGFNEVYSKTRDIVYRMACKMTRTEEEAMDVTQTVYIAVSYTHLTLPTNSLV